MDNSLIKHQAAIDAWRADFKGYVDCLDLPRDDYNGIMEYINEAPSAQPERKKGKWVPLICTSDGKHHEWCGYQCSICEERTLRLMQHNFCPNCGSDMREEGEKNDQRESH